MINEIKNYFDSLQNTENWFRFGKTFATKNKKYFLDTGTGKIFIINDSVYKILDCITRTNDFENIKRLSLSDEELKSALEEIKEAVENEHILSALPVKTLRSVFSCYFQNTSNYAFTIRNNITFSDLKNSSNEILYNKAVNKAGCKNLISELELKDNTYVTRLFDPNGAELSGGENQKLALARTFFKNAQIILLDEPTSALDPKAEKELLDELKEHKDNILIITSHKLTNIIIADKIILMDDGRIIEVGTKEELFNTDSEFNKLYSFQINTKEQFL